MPDFSSCIVNVAGRCDISVGTGGSGALEALGYSMDGVTFTENTIIEEVHGDDGGGLNGVPIEFQKHGEIHVIRMVLTKYDDAVLDKIRAGLNNNIALGSQGAAGFPAAAGTLVMANGFYFRLCCNSPTKPRNYLACLFREPKEVNKGTKHSQAVLVATAYKHPTSGVLWNQVVS